LACIVFIAGLLLKAVDYGWTAWDIYQSTKTLTDPNASQIDRTLAELNIVLSLGLEAIEPDDFLPVSIPADDVARKSIFRLAREALEEGNEEALERLPKWVQDVTRGIMNEEKLLGAIGKSGKKELVEATVNGRTVRTIPDFIDRAAREVGEIKDVASLGWSTQIQAQFKWATDNSMQYVLYLRENTKLVGTLADYVDEGIILVRNIEDYITPFGTR
jgi:hypothetical protein